MTQKKKRIPRSRGGTELTNFRLTQQALQNLKAKSDQMGISESYVIDELLRTGQSLKELAILGESLAG